MWAWYCVFSNWSQTQHFAYNKRPWRLIMRFLGRKYSCICQHNTFGGYWETDTRVFLHAAHAAAVGCRPVVIRPDDTDVFVVSLTFKGIIPCLSNAVNRLEQHTEMCQELFQCWGQNCANLSLVSTHSLAVTVSVFSFRGRASHSKPYFKKEAQSGTSKMRDLQTSKSSPTRCTALL